MYSTLVITAAICVVCFLLFYSLTWYSRRRHLYKLASRFEGPPLLPIMGNAHLLIGDGEHILNKLNEFGTLYPSSYRIWIGPILFFVVTDPDQVKEICRNSTTLEKGDLFKHILSPLVGTGLVTAPVSKWRLHRRLIQPKFNKKILGSYAEIFSTQAKIFAEELERHLDRPEFEVYKLLSSFTLDSICESTMGIKIGAQTNKNCRYVEALNEVIYSLAKRFFTPWLHPDFIFRRTEIGTCQQRSLEYLHGFADNVIKMRKMELFERKSCRSVTVDDGDAEPNTNPGGETTLDYLLRLTDETGQMSDQELRDEVQTLIVAGNETTANTMSWMMLMLASYPDVQDKACRELYEIYGDADVDERPVTSEDLMHMKYLERVIKETLRLFPAFPFIIREIAEELVVGQYTFPRKSYTMIAIHNLQRKEKYWPNPLNFNPDRFSPEENEKRHPYAFMAFSAGPRNCIGVNYAVMSIKILMATILRQYILKKDHIVPVNDIRLSFETVIKPVTPIAVRIERRPRNSAASFAAQK